jgi:hypothetical protein
VGLRLEGHHLTQSISVRGNRIVSVTPSSFSALPNRITSGKHAGLITLKDEEALARRVANDLATKPRVRQSEQPLSTIMSYAGRERANAQKVGIAAADLVGAQRDLLWQLVDTYSCRLPNARAFRRTKGARARRRSGSGSFCVVWRERAREGVWLSRDR